jgi:hypothetical protein
LFKDQFIGSYKGRICFSTSSYGRQQSSYRFFLTTIKGTRIFIDSKWNSDDPAASLRYVNHSCLPTGRFEVWNVKGYYRIGYFMNENVPANAELTADYRMVVHKETDQITCACPLIPTHKFPKLDSSRCQRVLCPDNGNTTIMENELIDLSSSSAQKPKRSSGNNTTKDGTTLPTSQSTLPSEQLADSGDPHDVGR